MFLDLHHVFGSPCYEYRVKLTVIAPQKVTEAGERYYGDNIIIALNLSKDAFINQFNPQTRVHLHASSNHY